MKRIAALLLVATLAAACTSSRPAGGAAGPPTASAAAAGPAPPPDPGPAPRAPPPAPPADTAVLRLVFLRGQFNDGGANDDQIIGLSVAGDVAAIFSDKVDGAATGFASPAHIENSVTTHEVGHLLGLVDLV